MQAPQDFVVVLMESILPLPDIEMFLQDQLENSEKQPIF